MRNRKKRAQREEVREILHIMRLELAARAAADRLGNGSRRVFSIGEVLEGYRNATR